MPKNEKKEEEKERADIPDEIEIEEDKSFSQTLPRVEETPFPNAPEGLEEPVPETEEEGTEELESLEPDKETKFRMQRRSKILDEEQRSILEQPFQNFGVMIMNILSSTQPRQHVKLYHFIKILAKRLDEPKVVEKLNYIFEGVDVIGINEKKYRIPLSVLQYVFDRDSMLGYSPTKSYQKRQITLAGVIIALDKVMETMIDYYMQLCDDHNIPLEQPIQPPSFTGIGVEDLPNVEE